MVRELIPGPTPAAGLAERNIITVGTQAPLTTAWDQPASCATAIPTISAGSCNSLSCTPYAASSIDLVLASYGASVNYPDFTTSQSQTSTACMPPGYANLKWMYFTGGTQCPSKWVTATTAIDATFATLACCPTGYPTPISVAGQNNFECYTEAAITPGQPFVLAAQGSIATTQIGTSAWVPFWISQSLIATTAWPTPTRATLYHPAVNFLVDAPATPTPTPTSASKDSFTLWSLGMGASIGVLVVIAVAGLIGLCCLYGCVKYFCGSRRRHPPLASVYYQQ